MELLIVEYKNWLTELKSKIRNSQIKAAVAVNTVLITIAKHKTTSNIKANF